MFASIRSTLPLKNFDVVERTVLGGNLDPKFIRAINTGAFYPETTGDADVRSNFMKNQLNSPTGDNRLYIGRRLCDQRSWLQDASDGEDDMPALEKASVASVDENEWEEQGVRGPAQCVSACVYSARSSFAAVEGPS